jgi:beta-glucanase (GH16 family)
MRSRARLGVRALTLFEWMPLRVALTLLGFCFVTPQQAGAVIPDQPGWQLSWHDEFDGAAVDTANWNRLTLKNSQNNEKQYYLPEQASIVEGSLRITASKQSIEGKAYRSARLESKQKFPMGRFEARIDLPTGKGMWPAFWLLPNGTQWPTAGEIDIMENKGSQPTIVSSAYHFQRNAGPCCGQHEYRVHEYSKRENDVDVNFHSGFHVYAVEWEAKQLRFFVDGTLHYTLNESASVPIFESPMNIILNLAVGGDFDGDPDTSTLFPQNMDVDYVRVWTPQTGVVGDYNGDSTIDAADYSVWRNSLGQEGIGLSADGSGNGSIGPEDYELWKASFGTADSSGTASAPSVPEPSAIVPMSVGLLLLSANRLQCRSLCSRPGWLEARRRPSDQRRNSQVSPR